MNVEILTIGNEILLGLVQDTNSNYLCRVIRGLGGRVRHVAIVRDEIDEISRAVRDSLERGADLILTCGGLGPTDDDVTLQAVATAMHRGSESNEDARRFVEQRYNELAAHGYVADARMSAARLKMARLPEGAYPIDNPVGAAPAAVLKVTGRHIVSLPGVPVELKSIVEGPLQELLKELFGRGVYRERELMVNCGDESMLAPALSKVAKNHPNIYIKSRASGFGADVKFRILISASAASVEEAERAIQDSASDLKRELEDRRIQTLD